MIGGEGRGHPAAPGLGLIEHRPGGATGGLPAGMFWQYKDDASGSFGPAANADGSPPLSPWPLAPSRMPGQITEWKVMLSLPMK